MRVIQAMRTGRLRAAVVATLLVGCSMSAGVGIAGAQDSVDDPAKLEAGQAVFEAACASCHGVDGTGSITGRALTGIVQEQPDRTVHIASVTNGKGGMPALGEELSPDDIDAAVTYLRLSFSPEALTELPRTGSNDSLFVVSAVLLAAGGALVLAERRVAATGR